MMKTVLNFIKSNVILCIAVVLAIITAFIIPPDKNYVGYFDFPTLCCLFSTLLVVEALSNIHFFEILARKLVTYFKDLRLVTFALVFITYFGSMLMANDMALITFLPLGYFVLSRTDKKEYTAFVFIMQNIAANLGGMLTPFGNPQNLYLHSYYHIDNIEFLKIMFPPFIVALLLIFACCFFVKRQPVEIQDDIFYKTDKKRLPIFLVVFAVAISAVLVNNAVYAYIATLIAFIVILFSDKKAFKTVNYPLLLTFCAFFVFSGNMSRIPAVEKLLGGVLNENTLLVSVLSCQVISNVPSATLLCRFTENYAPLLVGVNLGGLGTPIASLASLITLGKFKKSGGNVWKYLGLFSLLNFGFLAVLTGFEYLIKVI